tara:strand:+ start:1667 stop:2416 length:750 start_codon:yes stop_codon:yes gene_type:complete
MNKRKKIKFSLIVLLVLFINQNFAQEIKQSSFEFNYNYQIPIGNLSETYGNNSAIGIVYFSERSNNIIYGVEASFMFGSTLKDTNIFNNISTSTGAIIGGDGYYANVNLMQRGWNSFLFGGYAFHFSNKNLSGIYVSQGFGFLEHKIFIDTRNQNIPQLDEEMKKGYDRLTNGLSGKFTIAYKYYDQNGRFQMSTNLNYLFGLTKNQRAYDFANQVYYSQEKKWDNLFGISIGIIIPINRKNNEEFHYF